MAEELMKPDQEIETNVVEQLLTESLDIDQRQYLLETLEGDQMLAQIFDNLLTYATEFSGEGMVDTPVKDDGTTDPVPSRLEPGEFVFTRKSVEVIGADKLQQMMQAAEAVADKQGAQGPQVQAQPQPVQQASLLQKPQATPTQVPA